MTSAYNPAKHHKHAAILYNVLPSVYRERDKSKDLEKYLKGTGLLLDQVHETLLQRYADIFPDDDLAYDINSQTWILPYIAQLLDVTIISPDEAGKREEISNAVSWRKKKGTVDVVEEIAEAIGRLEVVVHEGWKHVATTARVGMPVLPIKAFGYSDVSDYEQDFNDFQDMKTHDYASLWSRHPGLPPGTVDFRCQSGAVAVDKDDTAAIKNKINGKDKFWRQSSLHGSQSCCPEHSILPVTDRITDWIPGYFYDTSVRTVDFRNPDWRNGHYHPDRVLLYEAPHPGFFTAIDEDRKFVWNDELIEVDDFKNVVEVTINGATTILRNKSLDHDEFKPIQISKRVKLGQVPSGPGPIDPHVWRFEGLIFKNTIEVDSGRLELDRCAALSAEVHSVDVVEPVLTITNTLCKRIQAESGLVELQYSTILTSSVVEKINASECIFNGLIRKNHNLTSPPGAGCVRYSSLLPSQKTGLLTIFNSHKISAVFYTTEYLAQGCGVLHPATNRKISQGAEDGGEMGSCHHMYISARRNAVITKLDDYLPIGMTATLIPDSTLYKISDFNAEDES